MKKGFAVLLCLVLLGGMCPGAHGAFRDISNPEVALAAATLQGLDIVTGTGDGVFSPNGSLTRAQACTMIVNTMGLANQVNTYKQRTVFSDVRPGQWYTGIVNLAHAKGIINGYGNGTFGPDDEVTYGQFATMLLRLLNYSTEQIGSVWPLDYTDFCEELGLSDGLSLKPEQVLTRGQAAVLLCRTLEQTPSNGSKAYYTTMSKVASTAQVMLLDTAASLGAEDGLLMVYELEGSPGISYYEQAVQQYDGLVGTVVTLLLDGEGEALASIPRSTGYRDVVIDRAKAIGIVDRSGVTHRIGSGAVAIVGGSAYSWGSTGYIQMDGYAGKTARLFYEDGSVSYVYLTTGATDSATQVAVAQTNAAAGELAGKLGITGSYSITKNGVSAQSGDLARYDVAYYDRITDTLCASDYQITGYIQSASPGLDAAASVTVSGCTLPVLESAWEMLGSCRLGDRVTLLLTDDCKVAAVADDMQAGRDMVGVLSTDGRSVTLSGSGLVLTGGQVDAAEKLRGTLVVAHVNADGMSCYEYNGTQAVGALDLTARMLGGYALAPECSVYERTGDGFGGSFVYSLSGERGEASVDFEDITWTDRLSTSYVEGFRLNRAGQVDVILLEDVTGNCYTYGKLIRYTGTKGIVTQTSPKTVYSAAVTVTNGEGTSKKYLSSYGGGSYNTYYGIALQNDASGNQQVVSTVTLTQADDVTAREFFTDGEDWTVRIGANTVPVSRQVQVYVETTEQWLSGYDAVRAAVTSGSAIEVHYDRTLTTGAQARVIVVRDV